MKQLEGHLTLYHISRQLKMCTRILRIDPEKQTAVINVVNKHILINLMFPMLDNIHIQK